MQNIYRYSCIYIPTMTGCDSSVKYLGVYLDVYKNTK